MKTINKLEKYDIKDKRSNTLRKCYAVNDIKDIIKDNIAKLSHEIERYDEMPQPDTTKIDKLNAQRQILKQL